MAGNNRITADPPSDDVNVKLARTIHEKLKVVAEKENTSVKNLLNYIVFAYLDHIDLLNSRYPHIRFMKLEDDKILLADLKENKITRVYAKRLPEYDPLIGDIGLYCEIDETAHCEHCMYCYLVPEGLDLLRPLWGFPANL